MRKLWCRGSSTGSSDHKKTTAPLKHCTDQQQLGQLELGLERVQLPQLQKMKRSPCKVWWMSGRLTWVGPWGCRRTEGRTGPAFAGGLAD